MKKNLHEAIFVVLAFVLTYSVVVNDVSLTGYSIANPFTEEVVIETVPEDYESKSLFVPLDSGLNSEFTLGQGNKVIILDGENRYSITALHVVQDYKLNQEYAGFMITPGDKRLRLAEEGRALIDFNNDGRIDALLRLESIAHGEARISLKSY
jgi:hypothetical protein